MSKDTDALESSIYRLFEFAPTPTILSFPDGSLEYVNPAIEQLLGYEKDEIFANDVIITHPDDLTANQTIRHSLQASPFTPIRIEKRYLHKNGHTIHGLLVMVAQPDEHGVVKRYIAQITDLTSVKQAKAAELLLYHLVKDSSDAIYVIDPLSGQILNANTLAHERLGYSKDELLCLTVPDINPNFSNSIKWQDLIRLVKFKEKFVVESSHVKKNGDILPVETSISYSNYNDQDYILAVVRDITERKVKESEIILTSNLDPLTKLPNRRILENKMGEILFKANVKNTKVAFLYLDLDGFKQINDTHGHAVGDGILKGAAGRLTRSVRKSDMIVRLGGDEFLILLQGVKSQDIVDNIANKIVNEFNSPFKVDDLLLKVSASIGVAIYPEQSLDATDLINFADKAMYQAKKLKGPSIHFHSLGSK